MYPGHHASYNKFGGYCYLNNTAICAQILINNGFKVDILDLDYHAGNGTANIFPNSYSIHANPEFDYPFYSCFDDQEHNFIFNKDVTKEQYFDLVNKVMDKIDADILLIPFGGDTYKDDPDASHCCKCCLDIEDYRVISSLIRAKFDKKIIVLQEGGYDMDYIDLIVESFLSGF